MRSLSWFIIYRRCARCPGSIKIFPQGGISPLLSWESTRPNLKFRRDHQNRSKDPWKLQKYGLNQLMPLPTQNCKQFYPGSLPGTFFFFKVASCRSTVTPSFNAHISHKLKHQRCFVSWLKKHCFIDMALGNSCFSKLVFDYKSCQETFFF